MAIELWSLDTEDDSKGKVHLLTFVDDDENFHTFRKPEEALKFLATYEKRINVWCTNLGYDIANLFQNNFGALEITFVKGRFIQAKISGTQVKFLDTLNHWKISVEEMGKRIGLHKLKVSGSYDDIAYNQRDALITRRFVVQMKETYETIGAKLKATIGSTALDFYYSQFGTKPGRDLFKTRELDWLLGGYYGGRVEIFHTRPICGDISYYDFNSLYPSVMAGHVYPGISGHRFRMGFEESADGIADVTVSVDRSCSLPYLPLRTQRGLIFPTGKFRGKWTHYELRRAQELGYKIEKAHKSMEFNGSVRPFDEFVKTLYEKRLIAQAEEDVLMSDSLKLIMNNLYGKFGQGNELTTLIPFQESKLQHGDQIIGDMILREKIGKYPIHTNVIWSAYTTAYGRDKLYRGMQKVVQNGSRLIYCDTDSIIFSGNDPFMSDTRLGELKLEGRFRFAHFKLPKLYKLVGEKTVSRAKGVPRKHAEEFFEKGFAEFMKPNKLRESLRRKLVPNEWHLTRKEVRREYDKRIVRRDGTTEPIHWGGADSKSRSSSKRASGTKSAGRNQTKNQLHLKDFGAGV